MQEELKVVKVMADSALKAFQTSWAQNKYWVMAHKQQAYNEIRQLAKQNEWNQLKQARYEEILQSLEQVEPTLQTLIVAYQHIWGYFKKFATPAERERYKALLADLTTQSDALEIFLRALAEKYQVHYLLEIRWIKSDES